MPTIKVGKVGEPLNLSWDKIGKEYDYSMDITYIIPTEEVQFEVDMPDKSFLGFGFGKSMVNVDMIIWHANGKNSYSQDYWSTSTKTPKVDDFAHLTTTQEAYTRPDGKNKTNRVKFVTRRKLDTGEHSEDFVIPLNQEFDFIWAINLVGPELVIHNLSGKAKISISDTLGNTS